MDNYTFDYYFNRESEQFSFYRIPKLLFTDEYFKGLSCEAKVLYGLMLDRMGLSVKNGWVDEKGRVYIIFTQDDVMELLNCKSQKAAKLLGELYDIGLTEKKRQGQGKPNMIYVKNFVSVQRKNGEEVQKFENQTSEEAQKFENQTSRSSKIKLPEVRFSNCNNTNNNKTEYSDISIHPINHTTGGSRVMGVMDAYRQVIQTNIDYAAKVLNDKCYRREEVDELVDLMTDIMMLPDDANIKVNGQSTPSALVKAQFLKIRWGHVDYVLSGLGTAKDKIHNIRAYLLTALYNAPMTMTNFYTAEISSGG